jgi:hypothetical protein
MNYIKPKALLDDLMFSLEDKSPERRRQCLSWLNATLQSILNEPRDWQFLHRSTTLTITSNTVTLPDTFQSLETVKVDGVFCLTPANALTRKESWMMADIPATYPVGYEISGSTLTFIPGTTETSCILEYQTGWPTTDYNDANTDTIIPQYFTNLVQRAILSNIYEFDREDFAAGSLQLDAIEMKKMKAWDNRLTPQSKSTPNGYLRVR